jgi:hypothetical protein
VIEGRVLLKLDSPDLALTKLGLVKKGGFAKKKFAELPVVTKLS